MILVKGLLVGAAALVVYLFLAGEIIGKLLAPPKPPPIPADGGGVIWVGQSIPIWPVLIGALLVFAAAFYWTFKKVS